MSPWDDTATLFPFQGWCVWSLHEPSPSLRASSRGKLLGLPLGVLGRAHGGCPAGRGAGQVCDKAPACVLCGKSALSPCPCRTVPWQDH